MNAAERQKLVRDLSDSDIDRQSQAANRLGSSADPDDIEAALHALNTTSNRLLRETLSEALVENAPNSLGFVLKCIADSPQSRAGQNCLQIAGEIAYRQEADRDRRIVPALLDAIRAMLPTGTRVLSPAVAALRECARAGPIPQANDLLLEVVSAAARESDPDLFALQNAAEILMLNDGKAMRDKLEGRLEGFDPDSMAAQVVAKVVGADSPS